MGIPNFKWRFSLVDKDGHETNIRAGEIKELMTLNEVSRDMSEQKSTSINLDSNVKYNTCRLIFENRFKDMRMLPFVIYSVILKGRKEDVIEAMETEKNKKPYSS